MRRKIKRVGIHWATVAGLFALLAVAVLGGFATNRTRSALAAAPGSAIYLPIVSRDFPLQTIFGVETQRGLFSGQGLEEIVGAEISWVRRNVVLWADVEPNQGDRNWGALASLEQELINASMENIEVVLIVRRTPDWAQKMSESYCGPIKSSKLSAFGNFMYDLVARYSEPPYNVRYYEIWNEPDLPVNASDDVYGCWGEPSDAYYGGGYFAEALKAAYPMVKAADPTAKVLVGGLLLDCDPDNRPAGKDCKPSKFLEGILLNDGASYFDGVSFHAYEYYLDALGVYGNSNWNSSWDTTGPVVIAKAQFLKGVLSNRGVSGKFLINTESGLLCVPAWGITCGGTFQTTKAYYVPQAYAVAIAEGLKGNVWYSLFGWRNSELLESNLNPRPAYFAFQFARSEIGGADFVQEITSYPAVKVYELDRGDRLIWVIWSLDGNDHSLTLPSTPSAIYDSFGTAVSVSNPLDLNFADGPLYIEWP